MGTTITRDRPIEQMLRDGDAQGVREALASGISPDTLDAILLLQILHVAVGLDLIGVARAIIDAGARFGPDRFGRWPSVIAAECEVSEEMCDLVVEAEAAWLERNPD